MNGLQARAGLAAVTGAAGVLAGVGASRVGAARPKSAQARSVWAAAGLLAASVLADSAIEHYRGSFRNPGMYAPLATSAAMVSVAAMQVLGGPQRRGTGLICGAAAAVGGAGLLFHLYNVGKRPGRLSWQNLFYGAPIGAPGALALSGALGLTARRLARMPQAAARRLLAGLGALGIAGAAAEAGLLHFRGAFQNPFMWAPVTLPPAAAALLAKQSLSGRPQPPTGPARLLLRATLALGLAGVGFHLFGISRAMGGWRNWRQNLVDGPPVPAPPAFSALAIVGLTALAA